MIWYPVFLQIQDMLHQHLQLTSPLVYKAYQGKRFHLFNSLCHSANVLEKPFLENIEFINS